jgi:glycosyltransferase involved in cell wall biosynthesis
MKLKVLQVVHALHIGGAERVVVSIASHLDRTRFDIEVLCVNGLGVLAEEISRQGIRVSRVGEGQRWKLARLASLRKAILDSGADVVHTHGMPALLNVGMSRAFGALPPWIHTYHFGNYPHIDLKYLLGERFFSRLTTRLVAVSDHQRESVIRHLGVPSTRIETVVNGVGANPHAASDKSRTAIRAELGIAPDDILVGCIAVLSKQKGIPYLLRAASNIVARIPKARFVVVGGGPWQQQLEQEASSLGLKRPAFMFAGWRNDALAILPALDVFVLPSLWEGLPIVVLEAMASTRAIVVTDVGDNSKVIDHGESGLVVPSGDAAALENAIVQLILDPVLRQSCAESAYATYSERFTIQSMVQQYERIYDRVAHSTGNAVKPAPRISES